MYNRWLDPLPDPLNPTGPHDWVHVPSLATNQAQYYMSHDIKGLHLRASQLTSDWYFTSANLKLKCIHNYVGFLLECECLWLKANKYYSAFDCNHYITAEPFP